MGLCTSKNTTDNFSASDSIEDENIENENKIQNPLVMQILDLHEDEPFDEINLQSNNTIFSQDTRSNGDFCNAKKSEKQTSFMSQASLINMNYSKSRTLYSTGNSDTNIKDTKYILHDTIHKSNKNEVYLALLCDDITNMYIYKKNCDKKQNNDILNEYTLLSLCDNKIKEKGVEICNDNNVLIKEYISGLNMSEFLDIHSGRHKLEKEEIYMIFYQICLGVYYLHKSNIMHRDLKLSNIMIDSNNLIKIIDLGFSTTKQEDTVSYGAPHYISPEMWDEKKYDNKIDMWALGVIFYYLLHGRYPFTGKIMRELYFKVTRYPFERVDNLTIHEYGIIIHLLTKNPKKRADITEILKTDFMKSNSKKFYEYIVSSQTIDKETKKDILQYITIVNEELTEKINHDVI
jgi:serine/threonine protein kinase